MCAAVQRDDSGKNDYFKKILFAYVHSALVRVGIAPWRTSCQAVWTSWKPADTSALPRRLLFMPAFAYDWQRIWEAPFHTAGVENADSYLFPISLYPPADPMTPRALAASYFRTRSQDRSCDPSTSWAVDSNMKLVLSRKNEGIKVWRESLPVRAAAICPLVCSPTNTRWEMSCLMGYSGPYTELNYF